MNSVARVAAVAQVKWAILKIQSREKLQSRGLRFFGMYTWQLQNGEALVTSQTT